MMHACTCQNTFRQNEDLTYTCSNSKVRVPSGPQEAKEKTDINVDASEPLTGGQNLYHNSLHHTSHPHTSLHHTSHPHISFRHTSHHHTSHPHISFRHTSHPHTSLHHTSHPHTSLHHTSHPRLGCMGGLPLTCPWQELNVGFTAVRRSINGGVHLAIPPCLVKCTLEREIS